MSLTLLVPNTSAGNQYHANLDQEQKASHPVSAGLRHIKPKGNQVATSQTLAAAQANASTWNAAAGAQLHLASSASAPALKPNAKEQKNEIIVRDRAALEDALNRATGGETIFLAPADYGFLRLGRNGHADFYGFDDQVTLTSLDKDNPARFSRLYLARARNLRIDGISFKADSPEDSSKQSSRSTIYIRGGNNIELINNKINGGNIPGEFYWGVNAISTYKSNNLLIENNDISGGKLGVAIDTAQNVIIRKNHVHSILGDSLRVANDMKNIHIEGNLITSVDMDHDLFSTHKDHIQFHTYNGNTSPQNIFIRDNILIQDTGFTQSIFMRNEGDEKRGGMRYQNVVIENNLIYDGHQHGIRISDVDNLRIQNNTLLYNGDGNRRPRIYAKRVRHAAITKNVAFKVNHNDVEISESNIIGDVNDLVIDDDPGRMISVVERLIDLQALPGSALQDQGVGSSLNRFQSHPSELTARAISYNLDPIGDPSTFVFDASLSANADGFLATDNVEYSWDLGDGNIASGALTMHRYNEPGEYLVTLSVRHANGRQSSNTTIARIDETLLANFDFNQRDVIDTSGYETAVKYRANKNLKKHYAPVGSGNFAYRLENATGFKIISPHLLSQNQFSLSFDLQKNQIGKGGGTLFSMPNSFELSVLHDGAVLVTSKQDKDKTHQLRTASGLINDLEWHSVRLDYDAVGNKMRLYVDGAHVAQSYVDGLGLVSQGNHKFQLGGKYSLKALVDNIKITSELSTKTNLDSGPVARLVDGGFNKSGAASRTHYSGDLLQIRSYLDTMTKTAKDTELTLSQLLKLMRE